MNRGFSAFTFVENPESESKISGKKKKKKKKRKPI